MQTGTLIIKRTNQHVNSKASIDFFIDNKKVGYIVNGETRQVDLPEGAHKLAAKIDWCKTKPLTVNIKANEVSEIELGSPVKFSMASLLFLTGSLLITLIGKGLIYEWISIILFATALFIDFFLYKTVPFVMFYYMTFGRRKYLYLKEV